MSTDPNAAPVVSNWDMAVGAFAKSLGKTLDEANLALKDLVGDPSDESLELLADPSSVTDDELEKALRGNTPIAKFRKVLRDFRGVSSADSQQNVAQQILVGGNLTLLPEVPDETSWLSSLRFDGQLKVDVNVVKSGMRATLAATQGLFRAPGVLREAMERAAERLDKPVSQEYYEIDKMLTKRSHGALLNALGAGAGNSKYATKRRRQLFLNRATKELFPALYQFNEVVNTWFTSWQNSFTTPALMMTVFSQGRNMVPMMQAPDCSPVRDAAEEVNNAVNRTFSGHGLSVANYMAIEAKEIIDILDKDTLPMLTGFQTKEEMLKGLNLGVDPAPVRLERDLVRYIQGALEFSKVSSVDETKYVAELQMLGSQILWETLGAKPVIDDASSDDVVEEEEEYVEPEAPKFSPPRRAVPAKITAGSAKPASTW